MVAMDFRIATSDDVPLLAKMNRYLVQDEGHRNAGMTLVQLTDRMRAFLESEYQAVIFETDGEPVAYALFRPQGDAIHLRQFYVVREHRRRGLGRQAIDILRQRVWAAGRRVTVGVLTKNEKGIAFWRALGFTDYALELESPPGGAPPQSL